MGKRKERRLAASGNSGRRVKLDLFMEPSGSDGLSGSFEHGEDEREAKHQAVLPNSSSSSGWFRPYFSKGLCRGAIWNRYKKYYVVCPRNLFTDYMNECCLQASTQIRSCHATLLI